MDFGCDARSNRGGAWFKIGLHLQIGTIGMALGALLFLQACSPNHNGRQSSEERAVVDTCQFSEESRSKLVTLGFFSVGDERELFWDGELPAGALGEIDIDISGIRWFYAYPLCGDEDVTYQGLPDLIRSYVPENSAIIRDNNRTKFVVENALTDLTILTFSDYRIAFRTRKP
jgi:hypothetical protein